MNKEIQLNITALGMLFLIISFLVVLPFTDRFNSAPSELSLGILLDLLITIPVLYYLIIRKTKIPNFTTIHVFIIGVIIASLIIPIEHQELLTKVKHIAIPIIEFGVIGMVVYKMTSLRNAFQETSGNDFYDKLLIACQEIFPSRMGSLLATEIAVGYYLFSNPKKNINNELEFTYFKKSGIRTVLVVLLSLLIAETFVVHLLIAHWSPTLAWVISFLGVYTMLQIIAILRSMNKRLISINYETEELNLRYGFGCQTKIPFTSIKKIEKYHYQINNDKNHLSLSLFDLIDTNNLTIHLNDENTLNKIYGIDKKYRSISLFVDEKDRFVKKIEKIIG